MDVRAITQGDVDVVAETLASAFAADPVTTWIFPERDRAARMKRFFKAAVVSNLRRGQTDMYMTADGKGAAIWEGPNAWKVPGREQLRVIPEMLKTFSERSWRALRVLNTIEARHPREPHYYLFILGSDPALSGRGLGTAAMLPVLQRCDEEGFPAYLESSNERNLPLYLRHGFEVTGYIKLPGRGPTVTAMWRKPHELVGARPLP